MRQELAGTVKTLFTGALHPDFIMLSTKHSAKVEELSVLQVLQCAAPDNKQVLLGK